jgi:hypothetical protein
VSNTSYFPVRFSGGPRDGETAETKGEPKRKLQVEGRTGVYTFAWDRKGGVRQRTGEYRWEGGENDVLAEPRSGDEASALLEAADGNVSAKDGASITPVPDITAEAADKIVADVAKQVLEADNGAVHGVARKDQGTPDDPSASHSPDAEHSKAEKTPSEAKTSAAKGNDKGSEHASTGTGNSPSTRRASSTKASS